MYRIRTKSKTLEANGKAFKLAEGVSASGMKRGEKSMSYKFILTHLIREERSV